MPQLSSHHLGENSTALPHVAQAASALGLFFNLRTAKKRRSRDGHGCAKSWVLSDQTRGGLGGGRSVVSISSLAIGTPGAGAMDIVDRCNGSQWKAMRTGQNKLWRGRHPSGQNRQLEGRRNSGHNPHTKFYESNGPDVKVRGTASSVAEKYQQLARDAHTSGDLVAAEAYQQYAEHYYRLIAAEQERSRA
jgi:hypothetical protein